ncbi:MAG: hypothetical protein RL563_1604 [Pseudomonadota bacterium]
MKRFFYLLLLLIYQAPLHAEQPLFRVETAYHQSALNAHSIEDVNSLDFVPYKGELRLGFSQNEIWIRLRIRTQESNGLIPDTLADNPVMLLVSPYFLDQIDFYEQGNRPLRVQLGGDHNAKYTRNCPRDIHCFVFENFDGISSTAYLRVQTTGSMVVNTDVMLAAVAQQIAMKHASRVTVSLTLSIALLVLACVFLLIERTRLLLAYSIFQASVVLTLYAMSGELAYHFNFLSSTTLDRLGSAGLVLRIAWMGVLSWAWTIQFNPSSAYNKAVIITIFVSCFNVGLIFSGFTYWALWINLVIMYLEPLIQIWGVHSTRQPMPGRWILLASWFLYLTILCFWFPISMGWIDLQIQFTPFQYFRDLRLNGLVIGIVIFWVVANEKSKRKFQKLQELQDLQLHAKKSQLQQEQLKERRELIDMLTHELKTPLSTIKFALASLKRTALAQGESSERVQHIDTSVDRMNAMIEHVALSNKIERADAHISAEEISAHELMNLVMQEYHQEDRFELVIHEGTYFYADPHFLALIVENLVSNAIKYASDGRIKINIGNTPAVMTVFQISNRVSEDSQPDESRLFERYYRHSNFQNHPGMGIGLSLVHAAAQKMGATVHYKKTGLEVTFEVRFPL